MAKGFALILFLLPLAVLLVSGCSTETGNVVETAKLTIPDNTPVQNQAAGQANVDIEEARREFAQFEKDAQNQETEANESKNLITPGNPEQNTTRQSEIQNHSRQCPTSCNDSNPCTIDFCSDETEYQCKHKSIVPCCGNSQCETGENYSLCQQDCKKPGCALQCDSCQILDNQSCACIPKECLSGDGCCPSACNYSSDSDCLNPDKCASDADCDDNNPCTKDTCSGQPKSCLNAAIMDCAADGCCPENCSFSSDPDCPRPSLVFSEIYYNPTGSDQDHEWIEVYNNGTIPIDMTKLRFEEINGSHLIKNTTENKEINPSSYAVIAENPTRFLDDYPEFSGLLFDSSFSLSNTGEELTLRTGKDGDILDFVFYNSTWGGDNSGYSLEKADLNGPGTAENWKQSTAEKGTPGLKNSISSTL